MAKKPAPHQEAESPKPRAFWKGAISFGLINIPVSLHSAAKDNEVRFTLLHKKDLSEIRYARICKAEDKEIPYDEIVKGYERDGRYVIMQDEDFKKVQPQKSNLLEVATFCEASEIDSIYFDKPYFLLPERGGEKAYALLYRALLASKKVALVQYTLRNHVHIACISPYQNTLLLNQLRYHSQLVDTEELHFPVLTAVGASEVALATQLIGQQTGHFEPKKYINTYLADLTQSMAQKKTRAIPKETLEVQEAARVYDIMALLKQSLKTTPANKNKKKKTGTS